jgi:predicted outer membrane repeat protein
VYTKTAGQVYNSIIYDNYPENNEYDGTGIYYRFTCTFPLYTGDGNISNAPLFVSADNNIFHHQAGSPCINAGSNALTNDIGDIDGTDRVISTVDMGCYEYVPEHFSSASNYYAAPNGENHYPYTTPAWAAHNLQDAINAAQPGDTVHVAPGTYSSSFKFIRGLKNRIGLYKAVTVLAESTDPADTMVYGETECLTGSFGSNVVRCAHLTNGAVLAGVTLRNGCTRDFGSLTYEQSGSGAFLDFGGVLSNCISAYNSASRWGGGALCYFGGVVSHCILLDNSAQFGAGVRCYFGGLVENCIVSGNNGYRGAGAQVQNKGTVRNCLITYNQSTDKGGGIYCYKDGVFENCTVSSNAASVQGGGIYCDSGGTNINMILYYNAAPDGANYYNDDDQAYYMYSCTTPALSGLNNGPGNISGKPLFEDIADENYRLSSFSDCIDAGTNMPWMAGAHDLDDNSRIHDDIVDMGAYEFIPEPVGVWVLLLIPAMLRKMNYH